MALLRQCRNTIEAKLLGFLLARSKWLWAVQNPEGGFILRTYEVAFIAAPNTAEEDLNKLNSQLESVVNDLGGKVTKTDVWGRRKLAYKIGKHDEGIYVILYIEGSGKEIAEVERRLRVSDLIIRHLTVRTDEDLKRAEKLKSRRKVSARAAAATGADLGEIDVEDEEALEEEDEGFDS
jgi:small subunit ribosomal protein S6